MRVTTYVHASQENDLRMEIRKTVDSSVLDIGNCNIFMSNEQLLQLKNIIEGYLEQEKYANT
jgi:uncharacterized Fe-S radical SAM superfamily protein PflX